MTQKKKEEEKGVQAPSSKNQVYEKVFENLKQKSEGI